MRHAFQLVLLAISLLFAAIDVARSEIHALVIGIDDYKHEAKLAGAVADANDIEAALRLLKPASLVVLRNAEASRARLEQEWAAIVARASPNDTIVFTYAGHGGREPWTSESGRVETAESFLLSQFRAPRPAEDSAERLLGKQLQSWFKRARLTKGEQLRIVFVADSCHAGGMMRDADSRAKATYRSIGDYKVPDQPIVIADKDAAEPGDLSHVTFIAATQPDLRIPEVVIDGRKRGALSYAFARAIEGQADRRGRGHLTNLDLQAFLTSTVRQLSEAQQTPEILYRHGGENETVLTNIPLRRDLAIDAATLSIRLDNADDAQRAALKGNLAGVRVVEAGTADLIWDNRDATVLSGIGDIVAEGVKPAALQGVVDKWRVLPSIKAMIESNPLDVRLSPSDARHPDGKQVTFRTAPAPYRFLTVFNLSSDGTVQFLSPRRESGDPQEGDRDIGLPFKINLKVVRPYGADHAIFISSSTLLHGLHERLRAGPRAIDLPRLLREALAGSTHAIGMQSLYTQGN